jgi:hypothetical protein
MQSLFAKLIFFILLLLFSSINSESPQNNTKLEYKIPTIDVYFESLSPESYDFILGSFLEFHSNPSHDKLATVNFLPYGKTKEFWKHSELYFNCTRGDNECFGNTVLICGMNHLTGEFAHNFIICMHSHIRDYKNDFVLTLQKCILDENKGTHILSCAQGRIGKRLLHDVGARTKKPDHIPYVMYNGEHIPDTERKILNGMLDFMCEKEGNNELPGCKNRQNRRR